MSVQTTADDRLNDATSGIDAAIKALADICVNNCWGHDEYRPDYRDTIEEVFNDLRVMKRKLHR